MTESILGIDLFKTVIQPTELMSGRPNLSGIAQLLIVNVFLMISTSSLLSGRCIAPGLAQTCQFNLGCRHITTVTTSGRWTVTGSDMSIQFDPKLPPAILHLLLTVLLLCKLHTTMNFVCLLYAVLAVCTHLKLLIIVGSNFACLRR